LAKSKKDHKIAFEHYLAEEDDRAFEYYKKHILQNPRPYGHIYHYFVETCSKSNVDIVQVYEEVLFISPTQENFLELYNGIWQI